MPELLAEAPTLSSRLRRVARRVIRHKPVRWGTLRRTTPLSDFFGFDRGLPVDRFYIERFLARFEKDIRGRALEVRDPRYTEAFGSGRVTSTEVLDIDLNNKMATLVADLSEPGSLPAERYDCLVVTQTLPYVSDPDLALENMWRSLAPGGTALLTVPCVARIDPVDRPNDRWRFTPRGLETLLRRSCPSAEVEVFGFGNVLAAVAFLMGIAAGELRESELNEQDDDFPLVACARIRKAE